MSVAGENAKDVRIAELETRLRELVAEVESYHKSLEQMAHVLRAAKADKFRLQKLVNAGGESK